MGNQGLRGSNYLWLGCWTGQRGHNIPLDAAARGHGGRQEGVFRPYSKFTRMTSVEDSSKLLKPKQFFTGSIVITNT